MSINRLDYDFAEGITVDLHDEIKELLVICRLWEIRTLATVRVRLSPVPMRFSDGQYAKKPAYTVRLKTSTNGPLIHEGGDLIIHGLPGKMELRMNHITKKKAGSG